ncbi:hypothetical protein CEP45_04640 [Mergibacter septicus]|nr:hypothetical protein CEP45_04640 [Mergibacter septicus]
MFSFGISELLTSILFTFSIFASFYYLSYLNMDVNYLGVSFTYKNLISILFLGFCISYSIFFSKNANILICRESLIVLICFYLFVYILLYFSTDLISYLFNKKNFLDISKYLHLSQLIVLFDSVGLFLVFHLRINNIKIIPPLLRLAFVFIGTPLGIYLSMKNNDAYHYLIGIMFGNIIFTVMIYFYYFYLISVKKSKLDLIDNQNFYK